MTLRLPAVLSALTALLACAAVVPIARALPAPDPSAELLFFTDDGTATGTPLLPGFANHSVWSGLGRASNGRIYIAVSNHQQPGGNVGLYRYDPVADEMITLGTIADVSGATSNWMSEESQYKVHTFLLEHDDGYLYFASDDHDPSPFLRGAHVYRIDPWLETVEDYSQTTPWLLTDTLALVPNTGENTAGSGVFIETYGIKGIGLNPGVPDLLYAMTYPDGHLIRHRLSDGHLEVIGQSARVGYAFVVDAEGDVYFSDTFETEQVLYKFDATTDATSVVASGLPGAPDGEIGAIAPTADGRFAYVLLSRAKQVWKLDTELDTFTWHSDICGTNWWRLYNLHLSPDEQSLYYVSNNNARSTIRRIDVSTGACSEVLDVDALVGPRDLSFGGVGIWDDEGNFYSPVWQSGTTTPDPALLKVRVEVPEPGLAGALAAGSLLLMLLGRGRRPGARRARAPTLDH